MYMISGCQIHDLITQRRMIKHTTEYKFLEVTCTTDGRDIQRNIVTVKVVMKQLCTVLWADSISIKMETTYVEDIC